MPESYRPFSPVVTPDECDTLVALLSKLSTTVALQAPNDGEPPRPVPLSSDLGAIARAMRLAHGLRDSEDEPGLADELVRARTARGSPASIVRPGMRDSPAAIAARAGIEIQPEPASLWAPYDLGTLAQGEDAPLALTPLWSLMNDSNDSIVSLRANEGVLRLSTRYDPWPSFRVLGLVSRVVHKPYGLTMHCENLRLGGGANLIPSEHPIDVEQFALQKAGGHNPPPRLRDHPLCRFPNTAEIEVHVKAAGGEPAIDERFSAKLWLVVQPKPTHVDVLI